MNIHARQQLAADAQQHAQFHPSGSWQDGKP
jgi:hypothetical protein